MPPKRAGLSRERVLDAALEIVDREGLDALSMRRVGEALGVEAMSLYNHVPSKVALLDGLHERILEQVTAPSSEARNAPVLPARAPPSARTWRAYARHQAKALRDVLRRHPNAVTLFATRPAVTHGSLEHLEAFLGVLREAGFRPLEGLEVIQCVLAFVVGHTLWTVRAPAPESAAPDYASLDPTRFVNVRAAAAALDEYDADDEFEHGLDALLRGITVRRARTIRGRRAP